MLPELGTCSYLRKLYLLFILLQIAVACTDDLDLLSNVIHRSRRQAPRDYCSTLYMYHQHQGPEMSPQLGKLSVSLYGIWIDSSNGMGRCIASRQNEIVLYDQNFLTSFPEFSSGTTQPFLQASSTTSWLHLSDTQHSPYPLVPYIRWYSVRGQHFKWLPNDICNMAHRKLWWYLVGGKRSYTTK